MQKKFYIFSFIIIFVSIVLYFFNSTYAKYKDKITGDANMQIARWNIKINNENINNKIILESNIQPVFDENDYIASNVLAPGASGYYDIIIDTTECDVALTYKITATNNDSSTIKDLIVTDYEINNDNNKIDYESAIEGSINLNQNSTTIRVYITWLDDDNATMDNEADTEAVINENAENLINNTIELTQKK